MTMPLAGMNSLTFSGYGATTCFQNTIKIGKLKFTTTEVTTLFLGKFYDKNTNCKIFLL